ncbi:hypothetical protein IOD13_09220 [Brevibacterium casei]|nr:hypothetical protein [Brevibacterium casei]
MVNRDESRISDADDERRLRSYTIVSTADIDRSSMGERWYVDGYGFGVSYLNYVTVTTTNFGPRSQGQEILASGDTIVNSGFVVSTTAANSTVRRMETRGPTIGRGAPSETRSRNPTSVSSSPTVSPPRGAHPPAGEPPRR